MRYLKRFNEELKTQTYKSAAAGLNKLGHTKRADDLNAWADTAKEKEEAKKLKEMIDLYSKHGVFKVDIGGYVNGNFYLWLNFDEYQNDENWEYWQQDGRFEGNRLWMTLDICLYPADDEDLPYGEGQWELTLNVPGNVSYIEGNEYNIKFVNRVEAMKFRKLIIDVLEGNIEMGETSTNPGGVKEKIIDFYCNKKGVSIEEFDNFVDTLRKITVNSFYKD